MGSAEPQNKPHATTPVRKRFREPQRARDARILAVQAVYQKELTGGAADAVIKEFLQHRLGDTTLASPGTARDHKLFADLVRSVSASASALDAAISGALSREQKSERLEVLLRSIMRCGAVELRDRPDVPVAVVINEYVDIAHAFYGGKEPGLVNAVLDRLAVRLRDTDH